MDINVQNVSVTYHAGDPLAQKALENVDISIRSGSYTAIIGHTGSGKSTFLQLLNGLLTPTEGRVVIGNTLIKTGDTPKGRRHLRQEVGLVFQFAENQLFAETVLRDVAFGPKNFGYTPEESEKKAQEALALVGISESLYEKNPFELSGGQMRRVAIAGVLAMEPRVLVLDEPTAGLDPVGRKELMQLFGKLHQKGLTMVLVTHVMEDVAEYADQVYILDKGCVVKQGSPEEVFQEVEFLKQLQVGVPKVTELAYRLQKRGKSIPVLPIRLTELTRRFTDE